MIRFKKLLLERRHLLIGLACGLVALAVWFKIAGYPEGWNAWGIPAAGKPFLDARAIAEGSVAYRQGLDPLLDNVGDINHHPLNYPRIWQGLYRLGLDEGDDRWLGTLFVGLFFAGILIVSPPSDARGALAMCAAVFSPAILFGLERGNSDLVIFFLLALAVALARRWEAGALLVVLLAFVLKLYPLAAIVVFLGRSRDTAVRLLTVALALVPLYLLFSWNDLMVINQHTVQSGWISYGMNVPWRAVAEQSRAASVPLRWLCLLVAAAWLGWAGWKRRPVDAADDGPALDGFRVGAACYAGTFLLSTNFDYKQVPLLLAIPQLVIWGRTATSRYARPARVALGAMYVSLWALTLEQLPASETGRWIGFVAGELGQWIEFAVLVWLLGQTLPAWVLAEGPWRKFRASRDAASSE